MEGLHTMSRLSWPCALFAALLVPTLAQAASPASGTLSQANPVVTWSGGPIFPSAAACSGPEDPACDHFALEIVPPPGGFTVRITLTPLDDWDLSVYDPAGSGEGTSGNPPGIAEVVVLSTPWPASIRSAAPRSPWARPTAPSPCSKQARRRRIRRVRAPRP
jgi:hypothetical protein